MGHGMIDVLIFGVQFVVRNCVLGYFPMKRDEQLVTFIAKKDLVCNFDTVLAKSMLDRSQALRLLMRMVVMTVDNPSILKNLLEYYKTMPQLLEEVDKHINTRLVKDIRKISVV